MEMVTEIYIGYMFYLTRIIPQHPGAIAPHVLAVDRVDSP